MLPVLCDPGTQCPRVLGRWAGDSEGGSSPGGTAETRFFRQLVSITIIPREGFMFLSSVKTTLLLTDARSTPLALFSLVSAQK